MIPLPVRHLSGLAACQLLLLCIQVSAQAPSAQKAAWTVEDTMKVKNVKDVQVSPDGRRVVFAVTEAITADDRSELLTHLHLAGADGFSARQITRGDQSCTSPRWSPDGRWIAFISRRSGKDNVWLLPLDGGEAEQLTDVPTGVTSFKWSPDGKQVAFVMPDPPTDEELRAEKNKSNVIIVDKNFKLSRLWVIPMEKSGAGKRPARLLTRGEFNVGDAYFGTDFDWSPDGSTIAFTHAQAPSWQNWPSNDISTVNVVTGEITALLHGANAEIAPAFSPDGRTIAYLKSEDTWGRAIDVLVAPVAGGPARKLARTFDRQPTLIGWSSDGQRI